MFIVAVSLSIALVLLSTALVAPAMTFVAMCAYIMLSEAAVLLPASSTGVCRTLPQHVAKRVTQRCEKLPLLTVRSLI
jgi:hypothetical protein